MISLKVVSVEKCRHDSVRLVLSDETGSVKFLAGQFLTIILNKQKRLFKSFSIASSPKELPLIELSFRLFDDEFSDFVKNKLIANDMVYALPPEGEFVLDLKSIKSKNIVFLAIGGGITPIVSILKTELEKDSDVKFYLFWGNRSIEEAFYWAKILNFEKKFHSHFKIINYFTANENQPGSIKGRMSDKTILSQFSAHNIEIKDSDFFISGSGKFVKGICNFLYTQNVPNRNIHIEKYDYAVIRNHINKALNNLEN